MKSSLIFILLFYITFRGLCQTDSFPKSFYVDSINYEFNNIHNPFTKIEYGDTLHFIKKAGYIFIKKNARMLSFLKIDSANSTAYFYSLFEEDNEVYDRVSFLNLYTGSFILQKTNQEDWYIILRHKRYKEKVLLKMRLVEEVFVGYQH